MSANALKEDDVQRQFFHGASEVTYLCNLLYTVISSPYTKGYLRRILLSKSPSLDAALGISIYVQLAMGI